MQSTTNNHNSQVTTTGKGNSQLASHPYIKNFLNAILVAGSEDGGSQTLAMEISKARIKLATYAGNLMPGGVVEFGDLRQFPMVKQLAQEVGKMQIQTALVALITNFCRSINVVRNMSEDQAIECAMYLLDECKDFTMEDFLLMFAMAKRGKLGTIMDHVDVVVIAEIHIQYTTRRVQGFRRIQEAERKQLQIQKEAELGQSDFDAGTKAIEAMKKFTEDFINRERIEDEKRKKDAAASRHRQIMEMVERDGAEGIAPAKELREYYLTHIKP